MGRLPSSDSDAEHPGLDVDDLAGPHVAELAAAVPAAGLVDGGPGRVAQLGPRLVGVKFPQVDRRDRLAFVQAHQPTPRGIQVEGLAVRGGQANELGGRLGQHASQRVGIGFEGIRPITHNHTPLPAVPSLVYQRIVAAAIARICAGS